MKSRMRQKPKKGKILIIILLLIFIVLVSAIIFLASTGFFDRDEISGSTLIEPELTVEYLTTDYANFLLENGATVTVTNIGEITPTDQAGYYETVIHGKEVVVSEEEASGYYLADTNTALPIIIDPLTRIVYADESNSYIKTTEEFVSIQAAAQTPTPIVDPNEDLSNITPEEMEQRVNDTIAAQTPTNNKLYSIYTMGTQAVLIVPFIYTPKGE